MEIPIQVSSLPKPNLSGIPNNRRLEGTEWQTSKAVVKKIYVGWHARLDNLKNYLFTLWTYDYGINNLIIHTIICSIIQKVHIEKYSFILINLKLVSLHENEV